MVTAGSKKAALSKRLPPNLLLECPFLEHNFFAGHFSGQFWALHHSEMTMASRMRCPMRECFAPTTMGWHPVVVPGCLCAGCQTIPTGHAVEPGGNRSFPKTDQSDVGR